MSTRRYRPTSWPRPGRSPRCVAAMAWRCRAALAFAAAHPSVASVVIGADHPDQVRSNAARHAAPLPPADLWAELVAEGLLRADAPRARIGPL